MVTNKVLIIVGPTSTGKTNLALTLADKFNGDLISADSRQVYTGLDIVTGKDLPSDFKKTDNVYSNHKTSIYGLDQISPDKDWSVSHFQKMALEAINQIHQKKRLPVVVGGTGFYVQSLLDNPTSPIPPNPQLRERLESLSLTDLQTELKNINPTRYQSLNNSDLNNTRRLIRAIEIAQYNSQEDKQGISVINPNLDSLIIGLKLPPEDLVRRIEQRVKDRIDKDLKPEYEYLLSNTKPTSPSLTTLGYKELGDYFANKITKEELIKLWTIRDRQYAKKQMVWFKKQPNIHWYLANDQYLNSKIESLVLDWINK